MIPRSRKRLLGLYAIALAMLVVLGGRLWYLQVLTPRSTRPSPR